MEDVFLFAKIVLLAINRRGICSAIVIIIEKGWHHGDRTSSLTIKLLSEMVFFCYRKRTIFVEKGVN